MLRAVVLAFVIAGCSYGARFTPCAVECTNACPGDLTCGNDGFCHAPGDTESCNGTPLVDAPGDDPSTCLEPCEVVSQCGCPGAACDLLGGGPGCRPVGTGVQGAPCDAVNDCAAGLVCSGSPPSRACHRFCDSDAQCQGAGGVCDLDVGTSAQKICTTDCDPVTGTGCPATFSCHISENPTTMRSHTECHLAGPSDMDQGAPCNALEDCAAGFQCFDFNPAICLRLCQIGGSSVCPGSGFCRPIGDGQFIDGTEYGACL